MLLLQNKMYDINMMCALTLVRKKHSDILVGTQFSFL